MHLALASGQRIAVCALSLDGLRLAETADISPVRGELIVPFQGFDVAVPVLFANSYGETFLWFSKLPSRSREMIDLFHRSILRGEMVCGEDIITRLDTPVDLIPMEETDAEAKAGKARKSPRWLRSIWQILFYLLLTLAVVLTVGEKAWNRLNTTQVDFARVAAPIERHIATVNGFAYRIEVAVGDEVEAGDLMIKVENPDTQSAIERIRASITLAERRLKRVDDSLAQVEKLRLVKRWPYEKALLDAIALHHYRDFTAGWDLDDVMAALAALKAFDAEPWFHEPARVRLLTDLIERREEIIADLRQLRRDLGTRKGIAASANIVAKNDGIVRMISIQEGQYLIRGLPAVDVEVDSPRFIHGHVNSELADKLFVGMDARFSLRTENGERGYRARIVGFDEIDSTVPSEHVGVPVQLEANNLTVRTSRERLVPGTPAHAYADRSLWHRFKLKVASLAWWN